MSEKYVNDDMVLNLDDIFRKIRVIVKKNIAALLFLIILSTLLFTGITQILVRPQYEASLTYLVTITGESQADAFGAVMLGSQMERTANSSGFMNLVERELKKEKISTDCAKTRYIEPEYDSSTNMFTIHIKTSSAKYTEGLVNAIGHVLPVFASKQLGYVLLNLIDNYVNLEKPVKLFSWPMSILLGIGIGVILSGFIVLLSLARNQVIFGKEDMKTLTSLSCLGELERVSMRKREKLTGMSNKKKMKNYDKSLCALARKVETKMAKHKDKVLMVTSSVSEEGKTTVSTNLALALAYNRKKVILLDLDIYRASIREQLKPKEVKYSLPEYLTGEASVEDILMKEAMLDVIYGQEGAKLDSTLLGSERMEELIQTLRKQYDYIIVDTAPTLWRSDADLFTKYADALLYVVQYAHVTKNMVTRGLQTIDKEQIHSIGYVLNGIDHKEIKYSDYYQ
ncbi:MAG: polysaccharide biosynthesis tyrosine autokinase [Firmicutes bacterium]|nr:polysaccharide biosynthesis tyrosine autokinase [Bacillota bacterium]